MNLQLGHVSKKEKFVAKRYIEDTYKKNEVKIGLFVEKTHQGGYVRGQYFQDIEELLNKEQFIVQYESFDEYVKNDCGSQGYIDSLIMDNIDENKNDKDFSFEELKDIVKQHGEREIVEALLNLKDDEILYVLSDCNGEYFGTDKNSLILENKKDGQSSLCYLNVDEILEAIESDEELLTVFIYNHMSKNERYEYSEEYENEN